MELLHQACRHTDAALSLRYELRTSRRLDSELLGKRAESRATRRYAVVLLFCLGGGGVGSGGGGRRGGGGSEARELH